jgi:hypothetical protein
MRSWLTVSVLAAACGGGSAGLSRVPEGAWGGEHVGLDVRAIGSGVLLDCAHGEITVPLLLDSDGSFSLPGYYVRDVGPAHDPENRRPATYFGSSDGHRLRLSFTLLDDGGTEGPFTAVLGAPAEVQRCR